MSQPKPIYLLSGGSASSGKGFDAAMQGIFKDIGLPLPAIAYVGVASGDHERYFQSISTLIRKEGGCRIEQVFLGENDADVQKAQNIMGSANAIFLSGGDVDRGMQVIQERKLVGFLQNLFQQGKLFFGASAGSIMMSEEWIRWRDPMDDSTAELFPCLGITKVICDTHDEAGGWPELQAALKLKKKEVIGYGITTGSCLKVFPDGRLEALGGAIARYSNQGAKVERLPDSLPGSYISV